MLVDVLADIVQVVVLSPCADTLLSIDRTREFGKIAARIDCALEDGLLELGG